MRLLVLTNSSFAPTHTQKLLNQVDYLNTFTDMKVSVEKDMPLADIEYLIMTGNYDCVYPTTVFEYSADLKTIIAFNKVLYQILEYHKQLYIGSDLFVHMLLNDKALTNFRCDMALPSKIITRLFWENRKNEIPKYLQTVKFPIIIKPNNLAASLGVSKSSIAHTVEESLMIIDRQFKKFINVNELLLEYYLADAKEFTVSVTGNGTKKICNTTALVSKTDTYEIFSYSNKNTSEKNRTMSYTSKVDLTLKQKLINTAKDLSTLLNVRDYSRFDFLMDEREQLFLIDANSLPSLGSNYFLEYIDNNVATPEQLLAILILVFCKRTHFTYPSFIQEINDTILTQII